MKTKRALSLFLALALTLAILPFGVFNVSAAVNHTLTEAINWCESKLGSTIDVDREHGGQCADLIMAYYDYLLGYHVSGNGCDYATNSLPAGMTRIKGASPQPGDVLVWTGGYSGLGHVAICGYDGYTYHQNWNGQYVRKISGTYTGGFTVSGQYATYWGVIRPSFSGSSPAPTPTPTPIYTTISNGTYYIKNNANGEYVSVAYGTDAQGQNVNTYTFSTGSEFQMVFTKTSGNGYKIRPAVCASRLINAYGVTVTSGLNVNIWDDVNESSQWWGLEKVSGGFVIRNMMNPSCVLTRTTTSTSNREINVSTYTGDTSQIWSIQNYITYDANGGSGAPSGQLKNYDETLYLSSTKPTRSGYTFLGWSTSSSATSPSYYAGGSFTSNSNTTLYAVWGLSETPLVVNTYCMAGISTANEMKYYTYTPTTTGEYVIYSRGSGDTRVYLYDANGNQIASDDDGGEEYNFRLQYTLTAGTTYKFGLRYYGSTTGVFEFIFGYAYTISYDANGGSGAPSSQTKDHAADLTLSSTEPTRSGYNFLGWSTSPSATSPSYYAGESYISNSSVTLYAVWSRNTYTVSYDANGGTGAPASQTKYQDQPLTVSSTKPTRSGYTFICWSTSATSHSGVYYYPGSTYTLNSDMTFYAVWGPNYIVSYDANGGTGAPSAQTKYYDQSLALSSTIPTRNGYNFLGWSTSSTGSVEYNAGDTITYLWENMTLYAVWEISSTQLSVNTSNSATISTEGETKYYTYTPTTSGDYVIYSTGSEDTKVYLYDANENEITYDDDGGEDFNFRLQYTLTAGRTYKFGIRYYSSSETGSIPFKFGHIYTITYNANGGTGVPSSQIKDYGAELTLTSIIPTRSGYTFLGWSTSSSATSATYSAGGTFEENANTTLYAVWEENGYLLYEKSDDGTYYVVSGYNGTITNIEIPSTYEGLPVKEIESYAFYNCSTLLNVIIPDSIIAIGDGAFGWCTSLSNIKLPDSIISIGRSAFANCDSLVTVKIPNSVINIGYGAFSLCDSLEMVIIGNSVETISGGYRETWGSESGVFENCPNLKSITIGNAVNTIEGGAFLGTFIEEYYISSKNEHFDVIGNALVNVDTGILVLGNAETVISDQVRTIADYAFYGWTDITKIDVPESVNRIGEQAFAYCTKLTEINIPNRVVLGEDVFLECEKLARKEYSNAYYYGSYDNPYQIFYHIVDDSKDFEFHSDAKIIAGGAFKYTDITSITIPDNIITIGEYAVYHCLDLTEVIIGNGVLDIGERAFAYNGSSGTRAPTYTKLVIGDSVENIGDFAFNAIIDISELIIPNSIKNIGKNAFQSYPAYGFTIGGFTKVIIPKGVTYIGSEAFKLCDNLTDIYCEAKTQPENWHDSWNSGCDATVHWGYGEESELIFGDITGDDTITATDYIVAKRAVMSTYDLTEAQIKLGDVNGDGLITATDYIILKRHVMGTYVIGG